MNRGIAGAGTAVLGVLLATSATAAQTPPATQGPAENGSPAWYLTDSFPDPGGRTHTDPNGVVTVLSRDQIPDSPPPDVQRPPSCSGSPLCGNRNGPPRSSLKRVVWDQTLGYEFTYPYLLPEGTGGVPAVALDSEDNLWVLQRKPMGMSQLFKFDPEYNLIVEVGPEVLPHHIKAHGMAVDQDDNVWVVDTGAATVTKISPEGELLMTLGERGRRGDWNEEEGRRLLWEPVHLAFAPNGDIYIAQGHGNESPNDTDSDDPANNIGAARILHLDRDGNYINQWFGHNVGQGKFYNAHALAIDPSNGDVWIGDREEYRIVIYNSAGEFLRSIQMRNLVCAIQFDAEGNPWMGSGQDGQFLKLDRDGKVIGAVGNGMGIGHGQFIEASYWVFDSENNMYAGDTSVSRVTKMVAPAISD